MSADGGDDVKMIDDVIIIQLPLLSKYTTGAKGTQRGIPMTKMTTENMNYVVCLLFTKI